MDKDRKMDALDLLDDFPPPSRDEWHAAVTKLLKGAPYEKIMPTHTYEGLTLEPMYRKEDLTGLPHLQSLPGEAPFVRGTHRLGYLEKKREIAQEIRYPDPRRFNAALLTDLQAGQTTVNIVVDRATRCGKDSDDSANAGCAGVAISTLGDLESALQNVDLNKFPLHIACGESALALAGFLLAFCRKNDFNLQNLRGSITADPLAELLKTGRLSSPLTMKIKDLVATTHWSLDNTANLATIGVDVSPVLNAGGNAVQELAAALATGVLYMRELIDEGLKIDEIAPRMSFTFAVGGNFFMEIAKFRAARLLWSRVVHAFGGAENSQKICIHAKTARWNKTLFDPYVNMLRTTTEAFSAVLAGVDSMHVGPFDEVIRESDDFSRRIARNTQIILDEESHLEQVVDPAGGSWYIEKLTHALAKKAWVLFRKIEGKGGMLAALQEGFLQAEIAAVAAKRRENLARRKDRVVGTTFYANISEQPLAARQSDQQKFAAARAKYLTAWRSKSQPVDLNSNATIEEIAAAAQSGATLGTITKALQASADGLEITPLKSERYTQPFEKLRTAMADFKSQNSEAVKVFLANMGLPAQHKARADFASGFFQITGFEVISPPGFDSVSAAAAAALDSAAPVVVLCGSDKTYPDMVPEFCQKIRQTSPETHLVLAGDPNEFIEEFKAAGIDEFIHLRVDALEILTVLLQKTGVIK